jgi:hypothetical protein
MTIAILLFAVSVGAGMLTSYHRRTKGMNG